MRAAFAGMFSSAGGEGDREGEREGERARHVDAPKDRGGRGGRGPVGATTTHSPACSRR